MSSVRTGAGDVAGLSTQLKEIVDRFGELIRDHLKLARIELATDLRIYVGALGLSLVAGFLLLMGYAFAWVTLALRLARFWGAPASFGLVAAFHLIVGVVCVRLVSGRLKRTNVMRESGIEARRSARLLAHPMGGGGAS